LRLSANTQDEREATDNGVARRNGCDVSTGCQWGMLPNDFPPSSTVQRYFYDWRDSGLLRTMNHHLIIEAGELEGREVSPSAGVIDSQSMKTMESGGVHGVEYKLNNCPIFCDHLISLLWKISVEHL